MIKRKKLKDASKVRVTFTLPGDQIESKTSVVGDFNEWRPDAHVMQKRNNGTYSVAATLDEGQSYAFRYFNADGEWMDDEQADEFVENEHGSRNGVIHT